MKQRFLAAWLAFSILLCCGCGMAGADQKGAISLVIDPENISKINGGVFEGWGTSLCWWANRLGYSHTLAKQAARAFCDPDRGLGLNILRYNIGGGDDPEHSHITRTDSMVPGYWKNPAYSGFAGEYTWEYDWSQDKNQRNVLEKCVQAYGDGLIVEAFSNSPPYFMTESGCSSGAVKPAQDNLRQDAYDAFARYLAEVAEHFATEWGIRFQSISPMNEPNTSYWGAYSPKQEGCHFSAGASQSRILTALREALDKKGLGDILISGTDETSVDAQIMSLGKLTEEAMAVIDRVDTHTYDAAFRTKLRRLAIDLGKNLWMSEVDGGNTLGRNAGEMGAGLWLSQKITDDLNGLTPSAWILWQAIDSHISKTGYLGRTDTGMLNLDGGYWGTAVADHDRETLVFTMKYYALGQFTRYIRPGSHLIEMKGPAVAALGADGKSLTVVVTNQEGTEQKCAMDLSAFGGLFPDGARVRVIRTSGTAQDGEHWKELDSLSVSERAINAVLSPFSVTTFVVEVE